MDKEALDNLIPRVVIMTLASAIILGFAHYLGYMATPALFALQQFLTVIGWMLFIGALAVVVVWVVRAVRS